MTIRDNSLIFWGKTNQDGSCWHPAICHMIDVGQMARVMLEKYLPSSFIDFLKGPFNFSQEEAILWISFLCALHDLGKIAPGFQKKNAFMFLRVEKKEFAKSSGDEGDHGLAGYKILNETLVRAGISAKAAPELARALSSHHGQIISGSGLQSIGGDNWNKARYEMVETLRELFKVDWKNLRRDPNITPAWTVALMGLVCVADWIGSNEDFFPYSNTDKVDLQEYLKDAEDKARRALQALGWGKGLRDQGEKHFAELFPELPSDKAPNEMQQVCAEAAQLANVPLLILVEAPMGIGKTEAALWAADIIASRTGIRGLYYALPTQATSNQMFLRIKDFLVHRFPEDIIQLQLLHGLAQLNEAFQELRKNAEELNCTRKKFDHESIKSGQDNDDKAGAVSAQEWFCARKRGLLSPYGVGTIDQALLGVLTVRHMFVRLFGLARKTLIIDEVHAYDTYMSTIIDRLLEWLSALGSSVILLSATLPSKRRSQLIEAYTGKEPTEKMGNYPRIICASRNGYLRLQTISISKVDNKLIFLTSRRLEEVKNLLADELRDGGCAAFICNTVGNAQETFLSLKQDMRFKDAELMLFHARFPVEDRLRIEKDVLEKFGKRKPPAEDHRPTRAILVATQVIEQSLDLDFDLMITELAPIDLMLQRAGRLHRHQRQRPEPLSTPRLIWITPEENASGIPEFGPGGQVYEKYILLKTLIALRSCESIAIPSSIEPLIGAVYNDDDQLQEFNPSLVAPMRDLRQDYEKEKKKYTQAARNKVMPKPSVNSIYNVQNLADDNEETSQYILTRLSDLPSITVICAHKTPKGISLTPGGSELIDFGEKPGPKQMMRLLQRSVRISSRRWYNYFSHQAIPPGWKSTPLLRSCPAAVFEEGKIIHQGRTLELSLELGLRELKEK